MAFPFYREYFYVTYAPRGAFSWVLYAFFLLLTLASTMLVCWYTTGFWKYNMVDCGTATGSFGGDCVLHLLTVKGAEHYWTCSEEFNTDFLIPSNIFIQPFFSVSERNGVTNILLSLPIGDTSGSVYFGAESAAAASELDAIQSITFIPSLRYRANGNHHTVDTTATPQLQYHRTRHYSGSTYDSSSNNFSGGPLCVRTEYALVYSTPDAGDAASCTESTSPLISVFSHYANFSAVCSSASRVVLPSMVREDAGGLELAGESRNIGEDLDLLNAFTWSIALHYPEACMPHTPQAGYSLKWGYIQFITIAWGFQFLYWQLRGIFATNGLIDLNAFYQTRLTGSRERIKN